MFPHVDAKCFPSLTGWHRGVKKMKENDNNKYSV